MKGGFRTSSKSLFYLFFAAGIFNALVLIDTLWSDGNERFNLFSIETNKLINVLFYGVIAMSMLLEAFKQNKKFTKKQQSK